MRLNRKTYKQLCDWKESNNGKTALLIEGARRVGKSYIAKSFGEQEYKSYLLIDFSLISKEIEEVFENDIADFDMLFNKLSIYYNTPLYIRESLIIFDEVQMYPKVRQLIKHLVADGRYDYIETGSLITLKQNVENIVIPSEEDHIKMYSLDFEEFLEAMGEQQIFSFIKKCFDDKKPLGNALHRKVMNLFRQYMIVGGMPQAVLEYTKTHDFHKTDIVKRRILQLYRDDVAKFAKGYESKVLSIFDDIPLQLSKHEKKFRMSSISKEARFREYEDSFVWLSEAMITNPCFNSTDPQVGLKMYMDRMTLKCYMADTGLLFSHMFFEEKEIDNDIYKAILFDKLEINEGMFVENIVAQMLCVKHKLFFYSRYDSDSRRSIEVDFLVRKDKKISPIEVKSSGYKKHKSLDIFKEKFKKKIGQSYIIYTKDLQIIDNIIYLPIYMTSFL